MTVGIHLLTIGDSVTWGQGLREGQKIHTLVLDEYRAKAKTRTPLSLPLALRSF